MGFTCGIIGLPNVGKSTIFSALTSAKAAAANFPFCTIEPNTGSVPVPDPRLATLAKMAESKAIIPTQITFVDIAGLIRGASKGEGLGNQFLGHIRSVDAVAHVVRCFEDPNIIHVEGRVSPVEDVDTINTELILADLDAVQKQIQKIEKVAKSGDKDARAQLEVLIQIEAQLGRGLPARTVSAEAGGAELLAAQLANLLTAKQVIYVANVSDEELATPPTATGTRPVDKLFAYVNTQGSELVVISGKLEAEIAELDAAERAEYLKDLGVTMSGLDRLVIAGYRSLGLITFFTVGPKEAHAWTAAQGTKAPQCAGKIHSDFEKGFIRAEVISYQDYIAAGSEVGAREAGRLRTEGKDYPMRDGDIVHFRFNV